MTADVRVDVGVLDKAASGVRLGAEELEALYALPLPEVAAVAHGLRGADAVHLASALAVGAEATVLAAWDRRLRSGAEAVGLALAPAPGS